RGGCPQASSPRGEPIDPGLVNWAAEYLNERTVGLPLGSHGLRQAFAEAGLSERQRSSLELLRPAFTDAAGSEQQRLFVGGAATVLGQARGEDLATYRPLLEALEQRATLLQLMSDALGGKGGSFVRVGME